MSSYFSANARALYETGSLMAKINQQLGHPKNHNPAKGMVDQLELSSNAEAQTKTIQTIDEMVGSQVDLVA